MFLFLFYLLFLASLYQCSAVVNSSLRAINTTSSLIGHEGNVRSSISLQRIARDSQNLKSYLSKQLIIHNDLNYSFKQSTRQTTKFIIIASSILIPGTVYRILVNIIESNEPINVIASISSQKSKGSEIIGAETVGVAAQSSELILIKVPNSIQPGDYELTVRADFNSSISQFSNGSELHYKAHLKCETAFLIILIETNQLAYNVGQTVMIRILLIDYSMKFYNSPIDVYLYESRDFLIKKWQSQYPSKGLVWLSFELPIECPVGWWKVEVHAQFQIEKRLILVERWLEEKFEVIVNMNAFTNVQEEKYLTVMIHANYSNRLSVHGNATIQLIAFVPVSFTNQTGTIPEAIYEEEPIELWTSFVPELKGYYELKLSLEEYLPKLFPYEIANSILEVSVHVRELYFGISVKGFAKTKLENGNVMLKLLDKAPLIFKPGMPLTLHLLVTYSNHRALTKRLLLASRIEISKSYEELNSSFKEKRHSIEEETISFKPDIYGVTRIRFTVPNNVTIFTLIAFYEDRLNKANISIDAIAFKAKKYLQVETSTENAIINRFAIINVRANFLMNFFFFLVSARGQILLHGKQKTKGFSDGLTTLAIVITAEMAPNCKVTVYHVTADEEIISDTLTLRSVQAIDHAKLQLTPNYEPDKCATQVDLKVKMAIDSTICISAINDRHQIQAHNLLSRARVQLQLSGHNADGHLKRAIFRDDSNKENVIIKDYPITNRYLDSFEAFHMNDLLLMTSPFKIDSSAYCQQRTSYMFHSKEAYDKTIVELMPTSKRLQCAVTDQCVTMDQWCDNVLNCADNSDEKDCFTFDTESQHLISYLLYRTNRNAAFYESTGHNFAWHITNTDEFEDNYLIINSSELSAVYDLHAFGINEKTGLSLLEQEINIDTSKLFQMTVESPTEIVIGEQVSILIFLTNNQPKEIQAEVILPFSKQYNVIQIDKHQNYKIKKIQSSLQHPIYLAPFSSRKVPVPIVSDEVGSIEVVVIGRCQVAQLRKELKIEVKPDGVPVKLYANYLINLTHQNDLTKYYHSNLSKELPDHQIKNSKVTVCFIGDLIGISRSNDQFINYSDLDIALAAETGELYLFNFLLHLLTGNYLRITGQLNDRKPLKSWWMQALIKDYVLQLSYFNKDCCFTQFKGDAQSTTHRIWLNAFALHHLLLGNSVILEQAIVDENVIRNSIGFLVKQQLPNGAFIEQDYNPLLFKRTFSNSDYRIL